MESVCENKVELSGPTDAQKHGINPDHGDALVIVDVQYDFLPGGKLAVPDGDQVLTPLNRYLTMFAARNLPIFLSGDWHPPKHCSFEGQGGPWPPHCLQKTRGAELCDTLKYPDTATILHKGFKVDEEAYSAFQGTGLREQLFARRVQNVFVGGLATDYCVLHTTRDALKAGFKAFLLRDAIRAVNLEPNDGENALRQMTELGARPVTLEDFSHAH